MDTMKIVMGIVGIVIAVMLTVMCLIPIVSDSTAESDTFTNDGFYRMTEITDSESITINWTYENPYVFEIDGVDFTLPAGTTTSDVFPYTIFATDGWGMRFNAYGNNVDLNLYGSSTNQLIWYATTQDHDTVTITLNEGTASFVKNTASPVTQSYTQAFIPDENGDYVLKKGNETSYLNSDSVIYSTGRTTLNFGGGNVALNINLNGNIDDDVVVTIIAPSTGYTVDNVVIDAIEVNDHDDLYKFNKVTFDITNTEEVTMGATYGQVIVPHEVTAERSIHPSSMESTMINIIPVLVVVGIILGTVGLIAYRRM